MKRVRSLTQTPPLMQNYLNQLAQRGEQHDWTVFKAKCIEGKRELQTALLERQHGLCVYCEIRVTQGKTLEVEHYLPKAGRPERHLDIANLLGGCGMSTDPTVGEKPKSDDPDYKGHYLHPHSENASCGAKKSNRDPTMRGRRILNPRNVTLPTNGAFPLLVRYRRRTGTIEPDEVGCQQVSIDPEEVRETISTLNLNCQRLADERKEVWEYLENRFPTVDSNAEDPDAEAQSWAQTLNNAQEQLCLDPLSNHLAPFWSTIRYYFADAAEAWLATDEARTALC